MFTDFPSNQLLSKTDTWYPTHLNPTSERWAPTRLPRGGHSCSRSIARTFKARTNSKPTRASRFAATEGNRITARHPDLHLTQLQETVRHSLDAARFVQLLTVGRQKVNSVALAANRYGAIRLLIQNLQWTWFDRLTRIELAGFQEHPATSKGMLSTAGEAQLASLSEDWLEATQNSTGDELHPLPRTLGCCNSGPGNHPSRSPGDTSNEIL
jgi:hypothetical protein